MGLQQILIAASPFTAHENSYAVHGTYIETIPFGATTAVIECWGASSGGAPGSGTGCAERSGVGGSSGGYSRTSISVSTSNNKTMTVTVGTAGVASGNGAASSVASGTFSLTTLNDGGGGNQTGGTASGGTLANIVGNAGGPNGATGAGVVGINGTGSGGGAAGFGAGSPGSPGGDGLVIVAYT